MTLDIPKNETTSDIVYTLSVSIGSTPQTLPTYTLTVKAPHPFDLNKDGSVDVMDVIVLIRFITDPVS